MFLIFRKLLTGGLSLNGMKTNTDSKKIQEILSRNVEEIYSRENLERKLKSGERLRIKLGFDPTGSKIHIGRAVILRKLKAFQDLGHKIIFIAGDFTAKVGDPSDKMERRPALSDEEIKRNLKDYKKQIGKILNLSKTEFKFNSKWLKKLRFEDIIDLAGIFSVQQTLNRRNFKERYEKGREISLKEFLYPLMQGYDSVAIKADVELGGSDQIFNLLAGRDVQKHYKQKEQDVLTVKMLEGTDGRKMSTSWGNVINITDGPDDMFGKIMSLKDELIIKYFELCTNLSQEKINEMSGRLEKGENPKNLKMALAKEIVSLYHNAGSANKAEKNFVKVFSNKETPDGLLVVSVLSGNKLADLLLKNEIIVSKSDFKRLVESGSITDMTDNSKVSDFNFEVKKTTVFKIGKHRFIKISII